MCLSVLYGEFEYPSLSPPTEKCVRELYSILFLIFQHQNGENRSKNIKYGQHKTKIILFFNDTTMSVLCGGGDECIRTKSLLYSTQWPLIKFKEVAIWLMLIFYFTTLLESSFYLHHRSWIYVVVPFYTKIFHFYCILLVFFYK